jgi:hypothetical protein
LVKKADSTVRDFLRKNAGKSLTKGDLGCAEVEKVWANSQPGVVQEYSFIPLDVAVLVKKHPFELSEFPEKNAQNSLPEGRLNCSGSKKVWVRTQPLRISPSELPQ